MENDKQNLEKPQTAKSGAWLISGLAIVVAAGAIIACLHFYQQNQRLEKGLQPVAAADANIFNLQNGISVSLPKNWNVFTSRNESNILSAQRSDADGALLGTIKIVSKYIDNVSYNFKDLKDLNAREKAELTEKFIKLSESTELNSAISVENRQVVDCKTIDLNGYFAISITARGKVFQYEVIHEMLEIFFSKHIVSVNLIYFDSALPLFRQEIDAILNSITPGRK